MRRQLAKLAVAAAERGLPDHILRQGCRYVVRQRLMQEDGLPVAERVAMLRRWHAGPAALVSDRANEQRSEFPAEFFALVLGPHFKRSSGLWDEETNELAQAEEAMLALSAERAGIEDGMRVLDLGCGWGSTSLYLAEHFPAATVVAVSNSAAHGDHIRKRAAGKGLTNVSHRLADMNQVDVGGPFDAVVSVESTEHVRNHAALADHLAGITTPDATVFFHLFSHSERWWEFEDDGSGDWMDRELAGVGTMPSHHLFHRLIAPHQLADTWWIEGSHHRKTLDAWLANLDNDRCAAEAVLRPVYGDDTKLWIQRWRISLMASSELFGFEDSDRLGISHHRVKLARQPRP